MSHLNKEQLEERASILRGEIEERKNELRGLVREIDNLTAAESARAKVAAMSEAERRALGLPEPIVIQPDGIESKEEVSEV